MTDRLSFAVFGVPQPAGSKTPIRRANGTLGVLDSGTDNSRAAHRAWREDVKHAARIAHRDAPPFVGPVALAIVFYMPAPKTIPKDRRDKFGDPQPTAKPDTTKLLRATEDALTAAGIWRDDAQVCQIRVSKVYADLMRPPGADITITAR